MKVNQDARDGEAVVLTLTPAEALVLFEWIMNHCDDLPIDDAAEQQVLWSLEGCLETRLAEPFAPDYLELLEAARKSLRPAQDEADSDPAKR